MSGKKNADLTLSQEQLDVPLEAESSGTVRARKSVTHDEARQVHARGTEHAEFVRDEVLEGDDGEVHVLPDGSVSIPVFEERLVVTKQLIVRERVVLRKHTVYEDYLVTADLRTEHLAVEADDSIADRVHQSPGEQP